MKTSNLPTLDQYWERLANELPPFSLEEQRTAVALYRELANGQALMRINMARAPSVSPTEARALLARDSIRAFVYPDDQGRVLGFGGLAAA